MKALWYFNRSELDWLLLVPGNAVLAYVRVWPCVGQAKRFGWSTAYGYDNSEPTLHAAMRAAEASAL